MSASSPSSSFRVSKRLVKELSLLQKDPPPSIAAWPVKDNPHQLHAQICGPNDSPYEGGVFQLELHIPESYPLDPPSVSFLTPLYHPNVDERGRICLDTLSLPPKGCWSPALTLASLLTTIHQLMAYPNGQDGLVREVADVYNGDRETFNRRAKELTRRHAMEGGAKEGGKEERKEGGEPSNTTASLQPAPSAVVVGEKRARTLERGDSAGVDVLEVGGGAVTERLESADGIKAEADSEEDHQHAPDHKRSRVG